MRTTFTILGCGSSAGVPRVGQGWGACDPHNQRNRRRRCSLLVERFAETGAKTIVLVDTSPDLRAQLLDADVDHLDGILLTHAHADHIHGMDDVRPLVQLKGAQIDIFMDDATANVVTTSFGYIFQTPPGSLYEPLLEPHPLSHGRLCNVVGPGGSLEATPFTLDHGEIDALGFRFGALAYTPDLKRVPAASRHFLQGLDVWIIDCLRYRLHPTHLCLDEALALIEEYSPRRAILTNLSSEVDYETLSRKAPYGVEVAYDGLRLEL